MGGKRGKKRGGSRITGRRLERVDTLILKQWVVGNTHWQVIGWGNTYVAEFEISAGPFFPPQRQNARMAWII